MSSAPSPPTPTPGYSGHLSSPDHELNASPSPPADQLTDSTATQLSGDSTLTDISFRTPLKQSTPVIRRHTTTSHEHTVDSQFLGDETSDNSDTTNTSKGMGTSPFAKTSDFMTEYFKDQELSPMVKNERFISEIFNAPLDEPLSRQENLLYHRMTQRLVSTQGNTFQVATPGHPLTLMVTRKQRVNTEGASDTTKRRAAQEIEGHRILSSVGSSESVLQQLAKEVNRLKKEDYDEFLKCSGIQRKVDIPSEDIVSMQAHVNLSTTQLRKMKPFFKKHNVFWPEEQKQREIIQEITSDYFKTKTVCFKKGDEDIDVPVSYVEDIEKLVIDRLNKLDEFDLFVHDGVRKGEIWLKFGGDHGKGSFKFCLQICNVKNPNSKSNTIVILKANIEDSYDNLLTLMGLVKEQIELLKRLIWKGRAFRVFVCGDYAFYSKAYGIAGATGTHFCVWCDITNQKLREQGGDISCGARTLEGVKEMVNEFEDEGMGDKAVQSQYENCINFPMLNIEIDHVVPPYLHILLGIMKRHHELLEDAAEVLDHRLMKQEPRNYKHAGQSDVAASLHDKGGNWRKAMEIIDCKASIVRTVPPSRARDKQIRALNKQLTALPKTDLGKRQGPIAYPLDGIMRDEGKIRVQPFHKRSYIGNDCHKYFMDQVYEICTTHIVRKVENLTTDPEIRKRAEKIETDLIEINDLYRKVHINVAHSRPIDEATALEIDTDIFEYTKSFRQKYINKLLPKHHFLESHIPKWIMRWRCGLALQGESGLELAHQTMAKAEFCARHLAGTERGEKMTLERHFMTSDPSLLTARPVIKERKRRKKLFEDDNTDTQ